MKTQEEIEQIAEKYATSIYGFSNENYNDYLECKRHCIEFYTQCQEDMIEKLEMHILINEDDWNRNPQAQLKDFINSLKENKQYETKR